MTWRKTTIGPDATHHLLDGKPLYKRRFLEVLKFHAPGLAPVRDGSGSYHIDVAGVAAYAHRFARTFGFYEGRAAVQAVDGWHHVLPDGTPLNANRYGWCGNFQGGQCPVRMQDGRYRHLDEHGGAAYAATWRYAGDFRDGVAVVQDDAGLHTHIDGGGQLLHGRRFLDLDVFHKGFARARDGEGWHHVRQDGNALYARRFAAVEPFYNGQARVERADGGLEVIDEAGGTFVVLRPGDDIPSVRPEPMLLQGRYRFDAQRHIHRGSTSATYIAQDEATGQTVVLKAQRVLAWHDRERAVLDRLSSVDAVPRLLDAFQTLSAGYLVLEHCAGSVLGTRCSCVPLPVAEAIATIRRLLAAVSALHAAGFLHGDLHPDNVLLDRNTGPASTRLLDFALALPLSEAPFEHGGQPHWRGEQDQGVWEFVAPEQFDVFATLTRASDTYSAVALLAYLVLGRPPFVASVDPEPTRVRARLRLHHEAGPDLRGLHPALERVVRRGLDPEPANRFQTATEFDAALAEVEEDLP